MFLESIKRTGQRLVNTTSQVARTSYGISAIPKILPLHHQTMIEIKLLFIWHQKQKLQILCRLRLIFIERLQTYLYYLKMFNIFNKTKNADGKYKRPYYSLRSVHSNRVLDIAQDGPNKGTAIQWEGWGGENQCFTIIQQGPIWYIKNKQNGQFLTVEGPQDGAKIFLSPKSGQQNQQFRIDEKNGSKEHVIYTYCGKALDVLEWKKDNGARISQYTFSGGKNQLWNFCDPKDITSSSSHND